ncbi:MAG: protein kinase [Acidobacteriota bacterium]
MRESTPPRKAALPRQPSAPHGRARQGSHRVRGVRGSSGGAAAAPSPSLPGPGSRVGRYEVLDELGRGGMGVVYRALDPTMEREVALKTLWPSLASEDEHRRRFLREARAASRLAHPNIVPVFEAFEDGDLPWLVMPVISGTSLRKLLVEQGRLAAEKVVRLGEDLAAALHTAHSARVLHRDITPGNVLLDVEGRALLADFGLARILPAGEGVSAGSAVSTGLTEPGATVGTPGYMSPEQALGKPLDARSDLFSFGAVLYQACTGNPPFPGFGYGEILNAILNREPEPISRFTYETPAELERIIRKALAKRVDERFQSAAEMLADLRALRRRLESGTSVTPPLPVAPRRRRLGWLARAAILAAALVVAGVAWLRLRAAGPESRRTGVTRQVTAAPGWELRPALSPDGATIAYVSNESGNADIWVVDVRGGNSLRLTDDPADDRDPAWFPDSSAVAFTSDRNSESGIWKVGRLGGPATPIVAPAFDPAISPDGTQIAFCRAAPLGESRVFVAPVAALQQATRLTGDVDGFWGHRRPAWSPDGQRICYADFRSLWLVPTQDGRPLRLTQEVATDLDPCWSSDGHTIFFTSTRQGSRAIWYVSSDSGEPGPLTAGTGPESQPSVSRDGSRLAYSTYAHQSDVVLVDPATGERSRFGDLRMDDQPSIAPNRSAIAFVSNRWGKNDIWLQPLRPVGAARRLTDQPGGASLPQFSPGGRWIAYHRAYLGQRDIMTVDTEGRQPIRFTDDGSQNFHPAWSPDGAQIVYVSERDGHSHLAVAGVRDGRRISQPRRVTSDATSDGYPAWSPDGLYIAFVRGKNASADVWLARADGGSPPTMLTRNAGARRLAWDPGGGGLLISGLWNGRRAQLRRLRMDTLEVLDFEAEVNFGDADWAGQFNISADGRLLAYAQDDLSGDIWLLEGKPGWY